MTVSVGEWLALISALVWAINGIIIRPYLNRAPVPLLNGIRCGAAGVVFWIVFAFSPEYWSFAEVTSLEWTYLIGSVMLAIGVGDTMYMVSLREIGVPRALAVAGTFPLPTLFFEWLLLDQSFTSTFVLGCVAVVAGVICLSRRRQRNDDAMQTGNLKLGILMALGASLAWGLGTVFTKQALTHLAAVQANTVRLPLVALIMFGIYRLRFGRSRPSSIQMDIKSWLVVAAAGITGIGLASYMYLEALKLIGAAKTTTLSACSPLFGLVLAMIFLGEKVDSLTVAGVVLCITGVWLVL